MQKQVSVGDEVVTSSGIIGTVRAMNDERVMIEIAPGTTVEIVRRVIGQRVPQTPAYPDGTSTEPTPSDSTPTHGADFQPPLDNGANEAGEHPSGFPHPSPKPDAENEHTQSGEGKST